MRETAFAKLNLALHVRERMSDGYHRLETLFAFADAGDEISVKPADDLSLAITGPFAPGLDPGASNLCLRAAAAIRPAGKGARLTLDKRLPVASGIGGGSADAAATLRLLNLFWNLGLDETALEDIARPLGADVPACVRSLTARGEGRGDRLVSQDGAGLTGMPLLLVNPGVAVATGAVFAAWNGMDRGALPIASPLATALAGRNDLEAPATVQAPVIADVLATLSATAPILSRMSGSGATCFALYDRDAARDAAQASLDPAWWTLSARLR